MNRGATFVIACIFLAWFFSSAPKQPEPIPTDGLIEAVASVKESMAPNHIPDSGKMAELSGNSGQLSHIVDANKKVDPPQASPSDRHEKARREIVVFSVPGCRECVNWVNVEQPKFERDGWTVVKSLDPMKGPWPHFLIDAANKQTEHRGYLPFEKLKEIVK